MPVEFLDKKPRTSRPIHLVGKGGLDGAGLAPETVDFARAAGFAGESGKLLLVAEADGIAALLGVGNEEALGLAAGHLGRALPAGDWHFATSAGGSLLAPLGVALGNYAFTRYGKKPGAALRLALPKRIDAARLARLVEGVFLARDLVNTPTSDMGPAALEEAVRKLAKAHKASVSVVAGDDLLKKNFPMIHAVGRASAEAPRLIDMAWGPKDAPRVTLVGKGVCFDTGGLDIKPASSMLLMKKDMGGAANVLGLASMIMAAGLKLRLRVLIPAVENSISANAFRPGDILSSRKGPTVEIGNTDAEGRLVLADALALADEEAPDLLVDLATLTGAARVALGPEVVPFYTADGRLASDLAEASALADDPLWRMPLWKPYDSKLYSRVADMNNVNSDGFAGSVIAALFLQRFVEKAKSWAHFDIFAWSPNERPHCPVGGEAQAIRALEQVLSVRYPA